MKTTLCVAAQKLSVAAQILCAAAQMENAAAQAHGSNFEECAAAQMENAAARIHKSSKTEEILPRAAAQRPHRGRTKPRKSVFRRFIYFWMTCTRPLAKNRS